MRGDRIMQVSLEVICGGEFYCADSGKMWCIAVSCFGAGIAECILKNFALYARCSNIYFAPVMWQWYLFIAKIRKFCRIFFIILTNKRYTRNNVTICV